MCYFLEPEDLPVLAISRSSNAILSAFYFYICFQYVFESALL